MPKAAELIAVTCTDLHLSLTPPACRADKDWLGVQAGYLQQVKDVAGDLPVLCAGDIFDRWNAPPELINFALEHLPDGMICVPGQHDLPNHNLDDMHRSGYGVLKQAQKIVDLSGQRGWRRSERDNWRVTGFGWGQAVSPYGPNAIRASVEVALIHRYFWTAGKSFPGAPEDAHVNAFKKQLQGYDVAITGDNHEHFIAQCGDCTVANMGGFIRRKSDELDRQPSVGLLYSDGTVKRHKLDTSGDRFHDAPASTRPELAVDMAAFISGLEKLGEHGLDFREAVKRHLETEDLSDEAKQIIKEALEHHGDNH